MAFDWSAFINSVLNLLIVAAVLYFLIVTPMNKVAAKFKKSEFPPPPVPSADSADIALLTEIRDLLREKT